MIYMVSIVALQSQKSISPAPYYCTVCIMFLFSKNKGLAPSIYYNKRCGQSLAEPGPASEVVKCICVMLQWTQVWTSMATVCDEKDEYFCAMAHFWSGNLLFDGSLSHYILIVQQIKTETPLTYHFSKRLLEISRTTVAIKMFIPMVQRIPWS